MSQWGFDSNQSSVCLRSFLLAAVALLFSACGGGDTGSSSKRLEVRPQNPLSIVAKPAPSAESAWREEANSMLKDVMQATGEEPVEEVSSPLPSVPSLGITEDYYVKIPATALGQEFLLQGSLIFQTTVPQFGGIKSRIVYFERRANELLMLESNRGHLVSEALPQELLLATFPIVDQGGDSITFDFNEGMSNVFFVEDWYVQDLYGAQYWEGDFVSVSTRNRFIRKAGLSSRQNALEIDQVAQLEINQMGTIANQVVRVKYYLRPYSTNAKFVPTSSFTEDFDHRGYFEVTPILTVNDEMKLYASKFDHNQKISFAVSANTPAEYRDAVVDGILYWNKAFGKDVIEAVDAPEGISAPSIDYNIVQWIDWDSAGMAYADAQMDPLTGEILNAQVFMTSVFAFGGKARALKLLKKLEESAEHEHAHQSQRLGLTGFSEHGHTGMCNREFNLKAAKELRRAIETGATDEQLLEMSKDFVRSVVAHEIGHTLGLRHNFAGSLATNFPLEKRESIVRSYVNEGRVDDSVIVTSSVMDYLMFEEDLLAGQVVEEGKIALAYDTQAIQYLYYGKSTPANERALFCTDSHVGKYMDCNRFDTGSSMLDYANWQMRQMQEQLPLDIYWSFVGAKAPGFGKRSRSPEEVFFNPAGMAAAAGSSWLKPLYAMFTVSSPKILSVRRSFPVVSPLNEEEVKEAEQEQILVDAERLGGIRSLMPKLTAEDIELMYQRYVDLLARPEASSGLAPSGESFQFTSAELRAMQSIGREIFDQLRDEFALADVASFENSVFAKRTLWDEPATEVFFDMFVDRLDYYVFSEDSSREADVYQLSLTVKKPEDESAEKESGALESIEFPYTSILSIAEINAEPVANEDRDSEDDGTMVVTLTVALPKFLYSQEARLEAAALLGEIESESPDWCDGCEVKLKDRYQAYLKEIFGGYDLSALQLAEMPRPVRKWVRENQAIADALPNKKFGSSK